MTPCLSIGSLADGTFVLGSRGRQMRGNRAHVRRGRSARARHLLEVSVISAARNPHKARRGGRDRGHRRPPGCLAGVGQAALGTGECHRYRAPRRLFGGQRRRLPEHLRASRPRARCPSSTPKLTSRAPRHQRMSRHRSTARWSPAPAARSAPCQVTCLFKSVRPREHGHDRRGRDASRVRRRSSGDSQVDVGRDRLRFRERRQQPRRHVERHRGDSLVFNEQSGSPPVGSTSRRSPTSRSWTRTSTRRPFPLG